MPHTAVNPDTEKLKKKLMRSRRKMSYQRILMGVLAFCALAQCVLIGQFMCKHSRHHGGDHHVKPHGPHDHHDRHHHEGRHHHGPPHHHGHHGKHHGHCHHHGHHGHHHGEGHHCHHHGEGHHCHHHGEGHHGHRHGPHHHKQWKHHGRHLMEEEEKTLLLDHDRELCKKGGHHHGGGKHHGKHHHGKHHHGKHHQKGDDDHSADVAGFSKEGRHHEGKHGHHDKHHRGPHDRDHHHGPPHEHHGKHHHGKHHHCHFAKLFKVLPFIAFFLYVALFRKAGKVLNDSSRPINNAKSLVRWNYILHIPQIVLSLAVQGMILYHGHFHGKKAVFMGAVGLLKAAYFQFVLSTCRFHLKVSRKMIRRLGKPLTKQLIQELNGNRTESRDGDDSTTQTQQRYVQNGVLTTGTSGLNTPLIDPSHRTPSVNNLQPSMNCPQMVNQMQPMFVPQNNVRPTFVPPYGQPQTFVPHVQPQLYPQTFVPHVQPQMPLYPNGNNLNYVQQPMTQSVVNQPPQNTSNVQQI